jgi:hypothetical protein
VTRPVGGRLAVVLALGVTPACTRDEGGQEPVGPGAPVEPAVVGPSREASSLHFSFDERVPELGLDGAVTLRAVGEVDEAEFERDCPDGAMEHYVNDREVHRYSGGDVDVYDHLVTLHTAAQLCMRGERANRNRFHDDCVRGRCVFLDCFIDPLKFKSDAQGHTPLLTLERELSIAAWIRPDPRRAPWGVQQRVLRGDDLSFGYTMPAAGRVVVQLDLDAAHVVSPEVELDAQDGARFLHTAATVSWVGDAYHVRLFLDGELLRQQDVPVEALGASPLARGLSTRLQGLGDGLCGDLDELVILDRALSVGELVRRASGGEPPG